MDRNEMLEIHKERISELLSSDKEIIKMFDKTKAAINLHDHELIDQVKNIYQESVFTTCGVCIKENDNAESIRNRSENWLLSVTKSILYKIATPQIKQNIGPVLERVFHGGKYEGRTYQYVIENDIRYIMWMLSKHNVSSVKRAMEQYGLDKIKITFGRYEGMLLSKLIINKRDYVRDWLIDKNDYGKFFEYYISALVALEESRKHSYADEVLK